MLNHLLEFLKKQEIEYTEGLVISTVSYIKIGGVAACAAMPNSSVKLVKLVEYLNEEKIPYRIVGAMSNILPCDLYYRGVLVFTSKLCCYTVAENTVAADCGVRFSTLIRSLARLGVCLAPSLFGIPGTVGGMVYSNAGAYGASISDFLSSAAVYFKDTKEISTLDSSELDFSYRHSSLMGSGNVLLSAEFRTYLDEPDSILSRIGAVAEKRRSSQPCGMPSLGSVFKRAGDIPISMLIDKLGLKGLSIGGAKISEKHAGFIVNTGGATEQDFLSLVAIIKEKIYKEYGIIPEEEIERL